MQLFLKFENKTHWKILNPSEKGFGLFFHKRRYASLGMNAVSRKALCPCAVYWLAVSGIKAERGCFRLWGEY